MKYYLIGGSVSARSYKTSCGFKLEKGTLFKKRNPFILHSFFTQSSYTFDTEAQLRKEIERMCGKSKLLQVYEIDSDEKMNTFREVFGK